MACVPKLKLVGELVSSPLATEDPVPDNATVVVGFAGSLLVITRLPVTLPTAVGVNAMAIEADCPAAIVAGVVIPLMVKSAPLKLNMDTVRVDEPVLERAKVLVLFTPTETVPKFTDVGLTDNCELALTADAVRSIAIGLPESAVTVSVPLTVPTVVGVTPTVNFVDWPASSAMGMATPEIENCWFET